MRKCRCATSQKVAGSIPVGVIGIFPCLTPSGRPIFPGSIQPFLLGKGGRCVGLTTLLLPCAHCIEILGVSTFWIPKGLARPVIG
jgi:hypothetical protein